MWETVSDASAQLRLAGWCRNFYKCNIVNVAGQAAAQQPAPKHGPLGILLTLPTTPPLASTIHYIYTTTLYTNNTTTIQYHHQIIHTQTHVWNQTDVQNPPLLLLYSHHDYWYVDAGFQKVFILIIRCKINTFSYWKSGEHTQRRSRGECWASGLHVQHKFNLVRTGLLTCLHIAGLQILLFHTQSG